MKPEVTRDAAALLQSGLVVEGTGDLLVMLLVCTLALCAAYVGLNFALYARATFDRKRGLYTGLAAAAGLLLGLSLTAVHFVSVMATGAYASPRFASGRLIAAFLTGAGTGAAGMVVALAGRRAETVRTLAGAALLALGMVGTLHLILQGATFQMSAMGGSPLAPEWTILFAGAALAVFGAVAGLAALLLVSHGKADEPISQTLEAMTDGLVVTDYTWRVVYMNRQAEQMLGRSAAELAGDVAWSFVPEQVAPAYKSLLEKVAAEATPAEFEYRSGSDRWYEMRAYPSTAGVSTYIREITESKQAEKERAEILAREQAARTEAEAAGLRLKFLAESSAMLSASLEYPSQRLIEIMRLAVPQVADWSAAYLSGEHGTVELLAVNHVDPDKAELAEEAHRNYTSDPATSRIARALQIGLPVLYPYMTDEDWVKHAIDERHLQLMRELNLRSMMAVPIKVRDRIIGAIVLVMSDSGRRYGHDDLAMAEGLAYRASVAVDHAMLYHEAQEAVRTAQEHSDKLVHVTRQLEWVIRQNELLLNAAGEGIYGTDRQGRATFVNPAAARMLGYEEGELVGREMHEAIHHTRADGTPFPPAESPIHRTLQEGVSYRTSDGLFWRKDGTSFPVEFVSTPILEGGEVVGVVVVFTDVTDRRRAEEALKEQERLYRLVTDKSRDVVSLHARDGTLVYISPSCESILGYTQEELVGIDPTRFIHPEDVRLARAAYLSLRSGMPVAYRIRRKSGEYIWFETVSQPITDGSGRIVQVQTSSRDITERKAFEEQLARQAYTDPLTGLCNRVAFIDRVDHAVTRASRRSDQIAVLFLDLDNFKVVNDSLGHEAGDQLLIFLARRLQSCLRAEDTAARLGGDEFTILLEGIHGTQDVIRVVERMIAALQMPFTLDGHEVFVTFSIGITFSTDSQRDSRELLREADVAMYYAKNRGKARYAFFDSSMNFQMLERLDMESDLHRALEREEFRIHYQPMVDLGSGSVSGVEALLRWEHPERGMIYPDQFIPLAEETGLIIDIGQWVLMEACRQAREWQALRDGQQLMISVNLSAKQLLQPEFPTVVARALAETGLSPSHLQLEVTETVLMHDVDVAVNVLNELKDLGVQLAVDDFGTGYSALSYFKRFPFDVLKIDRAFVKGLGEDVQDSAIVQTVISLAKTLNLVVVGEGIETLQQLGQLQVLGCDRGQGYHFARPVPGESVQALLQALSQQGES